MDQVPSAWSLQGLGGILFAMLTEKAPYRVKDLDDTPLDTREIMEAREPEFPEAFNGRARCEWRPKGAAGVSCYRMRAGHCMAERSQYF